MRVVVWFWHSHVTCRTRYNTTDTHTNTSHTRMDLVWFRRRFELEYSVRVIAWWIYSQRRHAHIQPQRIHFRNAFGANMRARRWKWNLFIYNGAYGRKSQSYVPVIVSHKTLICIFSPRRWRFSHCAKVLNELLSSVLFERIPNSLKIIYS